MQILILRNGEQQGPYSVDEVRQHLVQGSLLPTDLAWHEGLDNWVALSEIVGAPKFKVPPPPTFSSNAPVRNKSQVQPVYILIGLALLAAFFFSSKHTTTSPSSIPSDSNILDAVKGYCEQGSNFTFGMFNSIKLPDAPPIAGLFVLYDKVTISDLRVVKRGKPFHRGSGILDEGFPVRVYVKGLRTANYLKFLGGERKLVDLFFEGETDFVVYFESPDKSKVDPGPGKWIAQPN